MVVSKIGEIINSHCECPAGFGPHGTCKHLTAVALVLSDFVKNGNLNVLKTCTETLQTFQKPRKLHLGSPIKAQSFGKKNFDQRNSDPRPKVLRNRACYQDDVRNLTVNFVHSSGLDIAMRYTFGKADLRSATNDHDYLKRPFTQY